MTLIRARDLAKSYGRVVAVDGLNLTLDESSVTALIGPNGAGKTTTIKMILGLLKPDRGYVKVFGQDPWDNTAIRSLIGVVYEKAFFPPHQKTLNYLKRVCRVFGVPESRAIEVLELVNLQEVGDRPIHALSAGMLQKFAIAHALIHKPKLVVADEMTANLDPQARSALLDLVLQFNKDEKVTFRFYYYRRNLEDLAEWVVRILYENNGDEQDQEDLEGIVEDCISGWPYLP